MAAAVAVPVCRILAQAGASSCHPLLPFLTAGLGAHEAGSPALSQVGRQRPREARCLCLGPTDAQVRSRNWGSGLGTPNARCFPLVDGMSLVLADMPLHRTTCEIFNTSKPGASPETLSHCRPRWSGLPGACDSNQMGGLWAPRAPRAPPTPSAGGGGQDGEQDWARGAGRGCQIRSLSAEPLGCPAAQPASAALLPLELLPVNQRDTSELKKNYWEIFCFILCHL